MNVTSLARRQSRLLAEVKKLAETPNFARLAEAEVAAAEFEEELGKLQSEISSESFDPLSSPEQRAALSEEEFSDQPPQPSPKGSPLMGESPLDGAVGSPVILAPALLDEAGATKEGRPSFRLSLTENREMLEIASPSRRTGTAQTVKKFPIDRDMMTEASRAVELSVVRDKVEISRNSEIAKVDKKAVLRSLNEDRRKKFWASMEHFQRAAKSIIATGERMAALKFEAIAVYRPRKDFMFVPRRPKKPQLSLAQIASVVLIQRTFRDFKHRLQSRKLLGAFSTLPDARSRARARRAEISA